MPKQKLRVDHGPIDEDIVDNLTDAEKEWLRSWNRGHEIPGDEARQGTDSATVDEDEDEAYEDMSVAELKELLKARDLPTSGNKDELVARLEEDDESDED